MLYMTELLCPLNGSETDKDVAKDNVLPELKIEPETPGPRSYDSVVRCWAHPVRYPLSHRFTLRAIEAE